MALSDMRLFEDTLVGDLSAFFLCQAALSMTLTGGVANFIYSPISLSYVPQFIYWQ
jgi:hypothetical protein